MYEFKTRTSLAVFFDFVKVFENQLNIYKCKLIVWVKKLKKMG